MRVFLTEGRAFTIMNVVTKLKVTTHCPYADFLSLARMLTAGGELHALSVT